MKLLTTKPVLSSLLLWLSIASCDSEEENQISIMGTARYIETSLVAAEIPIKLTIFDSDNPFRANQGNVVYTKEIGTNKEGHYKFSFNRGILPKNASFMLSISTDSLIITGEFTTCLQSGSAYGGFLNSNVIIRDLKIDYPTYLQITFDKLNDMTSDRVILSRPSCSNVFESTLEKQDTTILEELHYFYFKKVDIKYYILNDNEETSEYMIGDILLLKNDTTKLTIDY